MPIVTVASTKGGVGKSTLTINLAVALQQAGYPVALLDADPQGSVVQWHHIRQHMINVEGEDLQPMFVAQVEGESLPAIALERSEKGNIVLIDSAGADSHDSRLALLRSHCVLTLCAPSPLDLWEVNKLAKIVGHLEMTQQRDLPILLAFNRVSPNPSVKSKEAATEYIERYRHLLAHVFESQLKDRIDFQHSIRLGQGVTEFEPRGNAAKEILSLRDEFLAHVPAKQAANT